MPNYITTTLKKIRRTIYEPTKHKVIQGGASAGKTYAIMTLLIGYAQSYPDTITTVVGEDYPHLKKGAYRDFKHIMENAGIYDPESMNKSDFIYYFPNGSIIEFASFDKMGAHGPRRDVLFVNEANDMPWSTYDQLATRTRDFSIIDYNPSSEFWAHTELVKKRPERTSFIIVTYKDNEALSEAERENIEEHMPAKGEEPSNWWRVYGLGLIGSLEGNIYHGWVPLSREPEFFAHAKLVRYGLDFGFTNDETALVAVYEDADHRIGLKELIYEKGLLGSQYPTKLADVGVDPSVLIVADGARPEIIAEIKQAGYLIIPADKNAGSIKRGIDRVKDRQIIYDGPNIEKEYLSYAWRTTRTGECLDVPEDGKDHCLPYDQKVKTAGGNIEIGKLVGTTGWVWSENGRLCKYKNVRKTGRELVYEFKLDNGTSFKCSGEHPIYTINRGPVPARLLNTFDLIQLDMYESNSNKRKKAKLQRNKLLERQIIRLLSQRKPQTACAAPSSMGVPQRANKKWLSDRSYRQEQGQQPDRKLESRHPISKQSQCFTENKCQKNRKRIETATIDESMAPIKRGDCLALRAWQKMLQKEKANRKKMCSMWENILYHTILRKGSLLLKRMQNESTHETVSGATREYAKMQSRRALKVEDVYCMDVMATSTFALDNGVIVSNCMDASRYAIDDLSRPLLDL